MADTPLYYRPFLSVDQETENGFLGEGVRVRDLEGLKNRMDEITCSFVRGRKTRGDELQLLTKSFSREYPSYKYLKGVYHRKSGDEEFGEPIIDTTGHFELSRVSSRNTFKLFEEVSNYTNPFVAVASREFHMEYQYLFDIGKNNRAPIFVIYAHNGDVETVKLDEVGNIPNLDSLIEKEFGVRP